MSEAITGVQMFPSSSDVLLVDNFVVILKL